MAATVAATTNLGLTMSDEQGGYLRYLYRALAGDDWAAFYVPQSQNANFALRYQIAFASYAVAALATLTPAYRQPYALALQGAIHKMQDFRTWRFWQHTAGVPDALPPDFGVSPDPLAWGNVQYSGHLATMLGLYAKTTGDPQFSDHNFTLTDGRGREFSHNYHEIAATIHRQQVENDFHGVPCEPGCVYIACNNHAMASNVLHDQLYGTGYAAVNAEWLAWSQEHMRLGWFPTMKHGVLCVCYMKEMKISTPIAFNFTDAWGVGLLRPFSPSVGLELYPRIRKATRRTPQGRYLPSGPATEGLEISDRAVNSGFAYIAAREFGDPTTAVSLHDYARAHWQLEQRGGETACWAAPRTLYATSLFALGSVAGPQGAGWSQAILAAYDPARFSQPHLAAMQLAGAAVGPEAVVVTEAYYDAAAHALHLTLRPQRDGRGLELAFANISAPPAPTIERVYAGETIRLHQPC